MKKKEEKGGNPASVLFFTENSSLLQSCVMEIRGDRRIRGDNVSTLKGFEE